MRVRRPARRPTVLDGLALVASCPRPVQHQLCAHTDVLRPDAGAVLARQGTAAREVVVIVAGEVGVECDGHPGDPLGPGRWFGADEVLTGAPHRCTVVAGSGVELRVITGPAFRAAAPHLPALARSLPRAG